LVFLFIRLNANSLTSSSKILWLYPFEKQVDTSSTGGMAAELIIKSNRDHRGKFSTPSSPNQGAVNSPLEFTPYSR